MANHNFDFYSRDYPTVRIEATPVRFRSTDVFPEASVSRWRTEGAGDDE